LKLTEQELERLSEPIAGLGSMQTVPSSDALWRSIPYQQAAAGLNMAIDCYFLDTLSKPGQANNSNQANDDNQNIDIGKDEGRSLLRFYGWQKPTISLGYHQKRIPKHWSELLNETDSEKLEPSDPGTNQSIRKSKNTSPNPVINTNIDIVRRPSGGRAVLHHQDLTYAIVTRAKSGNRNETYRYICEFLIKGFAKLGIEVGFGAAKQNYLNSPSCFNTATNADLVVTDGRKLVGSAQVYRHGWVLQHGSIALQPDYALLRKIFATEVPIVGVAELLSWDLASDRAKQSNQDKRQGAIANLQNLQAIVINALSEAASEHFQVELVSQPLTDEEIGAIEMLAQRKRDDVISI
jgi:lipoate-protein ligase A